MPNSLEGANGARKQDDTGSPRAADGLEIILARCRRGESSELRATLSVHRGRRRVVLRPFRGDGSGGWHPVAYGVVFDAAEVRCIRDALSRALSLLSAIPVRLKRGRRELRDRLR